MNLKIIFKKHNKDNKQKYLNLKMKSNYLQNKYQNYKKIY